MNYTYYNTYSDPAITGAVTGAITAMLIVYIFIAIVVAILQIIALWKVFTKAGEKGWKSIIPIYNLITLFKISGLSPLLVLVYLVGIIPVIGPIVCLVLTVYQANSLAKSFGKSTGFTVGLVLLAPIFYMILGFGKAEYVGTIKE